MKKKMIITMVLLTIMLLSMQVVNAGGIAGIIKTYNQETKQFEPDNGVTVEFTGIIGKPLYWFDGVFIQSEQQVTHTHDEPGVGTFEGYFEFHPVPLLFYIITFSKEGCQTKTRFGSLMDNDFDNYNLNLI